MAGMERLSKPLPADELRHDGWGQCLWIMHTNAWRKRLATS